MFWRLALAVVLPAVVMMVLFVPKQKAESCQNGLCWLDITVVALLSSGLWVGIRWYGKHLKTYIICGALVGLLSEVVLLAFALFFEVVFLIDFFLIEKRQSRRPIESNAKSVIAVLYPLSSLIVGILLNRPVSYRIRVCEGERRH
jgi:hypothetical protein